MALLYLALGGALGTLARYGLGGWIQGMAGETFPWGTLAVNVVGSFLLGFLMRAFENAPVSPRVRNGATLGFCGAFTTLSTVSYETLALARKARYPQAAGFGFGNLALGFAAAAAGWFVASLFLRSGA